MTNTYKSGLKRQLRDPEPQNPRAVGLRRKVWMHASRQLQPGHAPSASGNTPHFTQLLCTPKANCTSHRSQASQSHISQERETKDAVNSYLLAVLCLYGCIFKYSPSLQWGHPTVQQQLNCVHSAFWELLKEGWVRVQLCFQHSEDCAGSANSYAD